MESTVDSCALVSPPAPEPSAGAFSSAAGDAEERELQQKLSCKREKEEGENSHVPLPSAAPPPAPPRPATADAAAEAGVAPSTTETGIQEASIHHMDRSGSVPLDVATDAVSAARSAARLEADASRELLSVRALQSET